MNDQLDNQIKFRQPSRINQHWSMRVSNKRVKATKAQTGIPSPRPTSISNKRAIEINIKTASKHRRDKSHHRTQTQNLHFPRDLISTNQNTVDDNITQ